MANGRARKPAAKGDLQAEVMAALWRLGEAKVDDVRAELSSDLAYTTVHTVLKRLMDRGLAERTADERGLVYRPRLDEAEYLASTFSDRLTASSPAVRREALANLVDRLDASEVEEVARYANRIRRERSDT
ncbi:MAG TPA: BlaI/MecI/CopY family transcriptional regulator [Thermoleophilaceae bacterium]|jgi:predicted transcriptional regulator|nr:BlaI/MecI/CopY family transcriptional regulator [Thermoleophilaceae bacterium]